MGDSLRVVYIFLVRVRIFIEANPKKLCVGSEKIIFGSGSDFTGNSGSGSYFQGNSGSGSYFRGNSGSDSGSGSKSNFLTKFNGKKIIYQSF